MLVEAAMSHTFAQRPDTAADVASAAEELATQVCQQGAYIQEKKMPHEARKYRVGSITPVWCWKLEDKFGSTNTKYDLRDGFFSMKKLHLVVGRI